MHRADRAGLVEVLRVRCDHLARRLAEQGRPEDASGLNHACMRLTGPGSSAWRYDADGQPSLVVEDPAAVGRPVVAATPEDARRVADTLPMPNGPPPIVVVDGVSPPWLLGEIVRRTGPESHVSHGSGIVVIAPDWEQVVVALSHDEAVDWLGDPRVVLFAGDRAPDAFRAWLDARSAYLTSGATIGTAGSLSPNAASILQQLSRELRRKSREDVQLREKVLARDRARGPAYWAERYRGAINPISGRDASPLRVLVITTRYSTYMRHSAAGLAGVLNDAGYAATLLIEPDRHTKLSSVTYLRAIDEIDPDLIITINYQRRRVGDFIPGGIPYITWTQDAMSNLFDRAAPVAGSVRDFIVGHLERSMFMGSGDAAGRALCVPVLASESEFHPGPVAPDEARQRSCEVAWVSNHGVPPDQLSRDLLVRSNIPDERRRAIEAIGRELQGSITRSALPDRVAFLRSARDRFTSAGFSPAESGQLIISYALPLAERVLRHQTARWAKDICERRGWRMRVFGVGWESAREFEHLAEGPVGHGEALRCVYASATVTPHVNFGSTLHQRVFECAFSGGLPLCRRTEADTRFEWKAALRSVLRRTGIRITDDAPAQFEIADHPEFLRVASQQQRLGRPIGSHAITCHGPEAALLRSDVILRSLPALSSALGDLSQTTFASEHELEALLERAIGSPEWRNGLSRGIAERARERFSLSAMVDSALALVARSLEKEAGAIGA